MRHALLRGPRPAARQHACPKALADKGRDTAVPDGVRQKPHQPALLHRVGDLLQAEVHAVPVAVIDDFLRPVQRPVCAPAGSETAAPVRELRLVHRDGRLRYGLPDNAADHGWDYGVTGPASGPAYRNTDDGIGTVFAVRQAFDYFRLVASQVREQRLLVHLVNATSHLVRLNLYVRSVKVVGG